MNNPTRLPPQFDLPLLSRQNLPTMYDLPSEDPEEPGLPDIFHLDQPQLLDFTFQPENYDPEQVFTAIDLNLYYDPNHLNWHKRPDWFAVVGVPRFYEGWDMRLSYVMWQEQVSPIVIVELLSPGTEKEDLGRTVSSPGNPPTKWEVYEQILQVPYYVVFSGYTNQMQAFELIAGKYQPANLTDGRLLIPQIGLSLGLWQGSHKNQARLWLRWFTAQGNLIPTPSEKLVEAQQQIIEIQQQATEAQQRVVEIQQQATEAQRQATEAQRQVTEAQQQATEAQRQVTEAQQQVTEAQQQATEAQQQAERLAAKLRELGIDPNTVV